MEHRNTTDGIKGRRHIDVATEQMECSTGKTQFVLLSMKPSCAFSKNCRLPQPYVLLLGGRRTRWIPVCQLFWTLQHLHPWPGPEAPLNPPEWDGHPDPGPFVPEIKGKVKKKQTLTWWCNFTWSQKWERATCICKLSLIQEQIFSGGIVGGVVEVN